MKQGGVDQEENSYLLMQGTTEAYAISIRAERAKSHD